MAAAALEAQLRSLRGRLPQGRYFGDSILQRKDDLTKSSRDSQDTRDWEDKLVDAIRGHQSQPCFLAPKTAVADHESKILYFLYREHIEISQIYNAPNVFEACYDWLGFEQGNSGRTSFLHDAIVSLSSPLTVHD